MNQWKLSSDGKTAIRKNAIGGNESCLLESLSDDERASILPADPIPEASLPDQAKAAIIKTDLVAIRCVKAGYVFPQVWVDYDAKLRAIIDGTDKISTVLPTVPLRADGTVDYPA